MLFSRIVFLAVLLSATLSARSDPYSKGLIFSSETEYKAYPTVQRYRAYLPDSFDLSHRFPTAGSQGNQGSCVSWAVAYGVRSYYDFKLNNNRPDSRFAFSPSFIYNQIKGGNKNCDAGSSITAALNLVRDQGVPRISDFPYVDSNCSKQPTPDIKSRAAQYKIRDWKAIPTGDLESIKGELYRGNPVVVGMIVSSSFEDLRGRNIFNDEKSQPSGGHAMVITGYDDKRRAFRLFNSWGTNWGENGFGWVGYRAMALRGKEFYTVEAEVAPEPKPEPAPPPQPPAPPPAPPSTPKVDKQEVQRVVDSVECGSLKVNVSEKGDISLTGFAGDQKAVTDVTEKLKEMPGVRSVHPSIQLQPWPLCEARKTLELTTSNPKKLSLSLSGQTKTDLSEGQKLAFDVNLETKNAYLYLDYLQANGEAVTLERGLQVTGVKAVRLPPGGKQFVVQAPYGAEMLVAVLSPKPLFEQGTKYENDREYLSALRQALLGLSASERAQITSATVYIKTSGK
jgi:Papain family cysteine protease/Domain of unknown function (DUF4384)